MEEKKQLIKNLQDAVARLEKSNDKLEKQIRGLAIKVEELVSKDLKKTPGNIVQREILIDSTTVKQYITVILGFVLEPNQVSIVVVDSKGNLLTDVVGIMKDSSGTPIRASKSNKLGQMLFSSSVSNGKYRITISKKGHIFPKITVVLDGNILSSFEIRALPN